MTKKNILMILREDLRSVGVPVHLLPLVTGHGLRYGAMAILAICKTLVIPGRILIVWVDGLRTLGFFIPMHPSRLLLWP